MKSKTVKIVSFENNVNDCYVFREELNLNGINCNIELVDNFEGYGNLSGLKRLKRALRKEKEEITVFLPSLTNSELYLKEADFNIVVSAYSSWCDPNHIKVIPPMWMPTSAPNDSELKQIKWRNKPELSIGFMGNSYEGSKMTTIASLLPEFLKTKIIEGRHINSTLITGCNSFKISLLQLSCFVRTEAIRRLEATNLKKDIVKRQKSSWSSEEVKNFKNHLIQNIYTYCPRGRENYSFRFYEALSFGRIPVLIDTNMVLPPNVNWDELCVRVPYRNIEQLENIIRNDYENKTKNDFIERQEKALATMEKLRKKVWLKELCVQIATAL